MKKLFLTIAIVMSVFAANAQKSGISVGANVGLPLGDASDVSNFTFSVETNYLFEVVDNLKLGGSLSYLYFVGKSVDDTVSDALGGGVLGNTFGGLVNDLTKAAGVSASTDTSYIPVAAAGRYNITNSFLVGADLGYAVALEENGEGGFYYRPLVGYSFSETVTAQLSYTGIAIENFSASSINIGAVFSF